MAKIIQKAEEVLKSDLEEYGSTVPSDSYASTLFAHDKKDRIRTGQGTDDTSLGSTLSKKIDSKTFESDVAEYGTESFHSASSNSTSSSEDSKKNWSRRSTAERIEGMGSHLPNGLDPWVEPMFRPRTDEQARFMIDRVKQANGKLPARNIVSPFD